MDRPLRPRGAPRTAVLAAALALLLASAAPGVASACSTGPFSAANPPPPCWRPYNAASPFNQVLPRDPVLAPNSARMVRRTLTMGPITGLAAGTAGTNGDWAHPAYFARPSDPAYWVHCTRYPCRPIEGERVLIPAGAQPTASADGHMSVVQPDGWEYDFWQARLPRRGNVLRVGSGGRTPIDGDGLSGQPNANAARWGLLGGVIRANELLAGQIDHALVTAVACTRGSAVFPAAGLAAVCSDRRDAPATGQRFWLDMTPAEIDRLRAPAWKKTVLRALSRYGAFVGDTGGNEALSFSFESGATFTSFDLPDPMLDFARDHGWDVNLKDGVYEFDVASDVPWRARLRVVAPCVTARSC